MDLTERLDLRGGRNCWRQEDDPHHADALPNEVEVAVIGAGVMGAMVAQRLSEAGHSLAVLDRRHPVTGATAASTALVMWGADTPLTHLGERVGMERASASWRRVFHAVEALDHNIAKLGLECGWRARPEIYLAGDVLDEDQLKRESEARKAAGLSSTFLEASAIGERFEISPRAGLVSSGSYEVDPVKLTQGLLKAARANGASVCYPFDVDRLERDGTRTRIHGSDGQVLLAEHVVLATGYEAARLFLPQHFSLSSSYAIASKPGQAPAWGENALIWEASDPYLYARATNDQRIIFGGEDEDFLDAEKRDALIPAKRAALEVKAAKLMRRVDIEFECAWSSTFGGSPDGLPAVGRARSLENLFLAYGYGGNGVTFASLGAELIERLVRSDADEEAVWFDPYRPFDDADAKGNA